MPIPKRRGASRIADIPPNVLSALNAGRDETVTLVEWLAIDMPTLLGNVAPQVGLAEQSAQLVAMANDLAGQGVTRRIRGIGQALYDAMAAHPRRGDVFDALATHPSDMARAWAAFSVTANTELSLHERLELAGQFAADQSASVRECAWDSFRQYIAANLDAGIRRLQPWVMDADPNIRRCAVESTRPMGVWTAHIPALKADPSPGLALLEPVRSDPSRYVQTAVANWLNDASKSAPYWTVSVAQRWLAESPTPETRWIVNRGLRTLRKKGDDLLFPP